jgi:hypothetical protein
MALSPWWFIW